MIYFIMIGKDCSEYSEDVLALISDNTSKMLATYLPTKNNKHRLKAECFGRIEEFDYHTVALVDINNISYVVDLTNSVPIQKETHYYKRLCELNNNVVRDFDKVIDKGDNDHEM